MRAAIWWDIISDVSDDRLIAASQDKEVLSLINEPIPYYFNVTPLEYAIKRGQVSLKKIRFLITLCGAKVKNYHLECTSDFQVLELLHEYGARFRYAPNLFHHIDLLAFHRGEAAAVECALFYPHFWNTVSRAHQLKDIGSDFDRSLVEKIMGLARHRSEAAHKARTAMLSLTYGGTKHLSKDMLRLVIGHMKNAKYVAHPAWGIH